MNKTPIKPEKDLSISSIDIVISKRMAKIRSIKGISAEIMADELNINIEELRDYETGNRKISASLLFRMAQFACVDLSLVFSDEPLNDFPPSGID